MSFSIGPHATCGELNASSLDVPYGSGAPVKTLTFADNGSTLAVPKGLYLINTTDGQTVINIPAGKKSGDILEFITVRSNGNDCVLNLLIHSSGNTQIEFGTISGNYIKIMWLQDQGPGIGDAWWVLARGSGSPANGTSVADLPRIV